MPARPAAASNTAAGCAFNAHLLCCCPLRRNRLQAARTESRPTLAPQEHQLEHWSQPEGGHRKACKRLKAEKEAAANVQAQQAGSAAERQSVGWSLHQAQ